MLVCDGMRLPIQRRIHSLRLAVASGIAMHKQFGSKDSSPIENIAVALNIIIILPRSHIGETVEDITFQYNYPIPYTRPIIITPTLLEAPLHLEHARPKYIGSIKYCSSLFPLRY
jgi:hypothetical protein